jgi:hypothetical protein
MRLNNTTATPQWGRYPWFAGTHDDLVHHDDRDALMRFGPYGRVFVRLADADDWWVIAHGEHHFRVNAVLWKPCEAPRFVPGEVVCVKARPERSATIREVWWHSNKKCPFYFLTVDGRTSTRRYFEAELMV